MRGLSYPLEEDCDLEIFTFDDEEGKKTFWHTSPTSANAVTRLFPEAKFGIGPSIDNGFYYDIDLEHRFSEEDCPTGKRMRKSRGEAAADPRWSYPKRSV